MLENNGCIDDEQEVDLFMQLASYGKTLDKAQRYEEADRKREMKRGRQKLNVFCKKKRLNRPKGKICTVGEEKRKVKDEVSKDENSSRLRYCYKKINGL